MSRPWLVLVESNTTGSGRLFCARAAARGLLPVVLARDVSRYPYLRADAINTRVVDTADADAVAEACREPARLAGVTSSSEFFIARAAATAAAFGLPAPDPQAVERCRDKRRQRAALADAGVPVPAFAAVDTAADAVEAAARIGLPVVLKPAAGSGSAGVRLCSDLADVRAWAGQLGGDILVERYVPGPEFSVESFDEAVVCVVGKHLGAPPHFVETGHDVPARCSTRRHAELGRTALAALDALGLGWGAAHTELRMTPDGPVVIEVNPRLAGGMIPAAVQAASGVDLVDMAVARAAGQPVPRPLPDGGHAAVRFAVTGSGGRVRATLGLDRARALPGVHAAGFTVEPGQELAITHSFRDRVGYAVATGPDGDTAAERARSAAGCLAVDLSQADDSGGIHV
ncbi:ATP-grasp domain-containing protein [Saccharothrix longispora]|uniref:ATP-grasp domain-containing protein n=1 Tax=Saccharothrix longispora TaxID=33920 RepID=UPI0028FD08C9|nr:ATP-grasp domain-containing protein [Saccharothrix longispora]MBY8848166.1 ATP-grasp domain-containing protein [Saccharothrix sp. MB29]MDU0294213.1 ATP-grasp domain-containing protein [Saccharothrix longispora]